MISRRTPRFDHETRADTGAFAHKYVHFANAPGVAKHLGHAGPNFLLQPAQVTPQALGGAAPERHRKVKRMPLTAAEWDAAWGV